MKRNLLLVAATLLLLASLPASAQNLWGEAGSSGIIDESSAALYEFSGPTLRFKAGAVGTIVARYPIDSDSSNPGWASMSLSYAGAGVTVRVVEVNQCSAAEVTVTTFNNPNSPEATICVGHIFGGWPYNFSQHVYYLEVTLTRATTATNPQFHHARFP